MLRHNAHIANSGVEGRRGLEAADTSGDRFIFEFPIKSCGQTERPTDESAAERPKSAPAATFYRPQFQWLTCNLRRPLMRSGRKAGLSPQSEAHFPAILFLFFGWS